MMKRLLLAAAFAIASLVPARADDVFERRIEEVAPHIYVSWRPDELRQPVEGNIVFVVGENSVVAIDSGGTPQSAEQAIRLLRTVTDKPVTTLITTHWHGDHCLGNQIFAAAFPGLEIVGTQATRDAMTGKPMSYVADYRDNLLPSVIADIEKTLKEGKAEDGSPLPDDRRARMAAFLADVVAYQKEMARVEIVPPTRIVNEDTTITVDGRDFQILLIGHNHADGDLAVWLPAERILISGDVIAAPIPFGTASAPRHWAATLDRLTALAPALIIPGHGPAGIGSADVDNLKALLLTIADQADAAVAANRTLDDFRKSLVIGAAGAPYEGDGRQNAMFADTFVAPIARGAWLEAKGEPIPQGALDTQ